MQMYYSTGGMKLRRDDFTEEVEVEDLENSKGGGGEHKNYYREMEYNNE